MRQFLRRFCDVTLHRRLQCKRLLGSCHVALRRKLGAWIALLFGLFDYTMNRRNAGMPDRHAMLTQQAYPSSSSAIPRTAAGFESPWRTDSPFENPYGFGSGHAVGDEQGAPKKEAPPPSRFMSMFSGTAAQERSAADLEEQNDARLSGLSERIKLLKDVCTRC